MLITTATTRVHVFDRRRETKAEREKWKRAQKGESDYARKLRAIADQVGKIVQGIQSDPDIDAVTATSIIQNAMAKYSAAIEPWARATARRMIADVARRDEAVWANLSKTMAGSLRQQIRHAPTGKFLRAILEENVTLITSLPLEAAQRVHKLTVESLETSGRADAIAKEILRTGEVTRARANLIARTEVARTASGLVEVRSKFVGSEAYIWRSSRDADVRNTDGNPVGSHRLLDGKVIRWDSPPVASTTGVRAHAGQIYNCRCWPEPILTSE